MSLAVLRSRGLAGLQAPMVTVEVHLSRGLPGFTIVGLPDTEVKESKDRVRAALLNAGFDFPARRITVNLAPADLPKESGRFDLPIALGILASSGQMPLETLDHYEFAGELSLSGELRPIRGALAMTFAMRQANASRAFILPQANASEAALVSHVTILPAVSLLAVCAHFSRRQEATRLVPYVAPTDFSSQMPAFSHVDFQDVKGQLLAKRALEVAAAGRHSVLMMGPPGTGKSMLANRFPGILPPMTEEEALEIASIQSLHAAFSLSSWRVRPFRAPHHTSSGVALVGGGGTPRPGEVSLAHHGVLFLDELPEFNRRVLEVLREPLESGRITISRAARQADFPAAFQLIAAMNPCPCGYFGHGSHPCRCSSESIARYQGKISGPFLDRIDMQIQVGAMPHEELLKQGGNEPSSAIRQRVEKAYARQIARQGKTNQALLGAALEKHCVLDDAGKKILHQAIERFHWSARSYDRTLKVARTIADMADSEQITALHMAEAIQYRRVLKEKT